MRRLNRVRIDPKRRRNAAVPELLLSDLDRHLQVVEQRRVNVAELMPRHCAEPSRFRCRLQHPREQLRLTQRVALSIAEHQVARSLAADTRLVLEERRHDVRPEWNGPHRLLGLWRLESSLVD